MFRRPLMRHGPGLLGAPAGSPATDTPSTGHLSASEVAQLQGLMRLGARGVLTDAEVVMVTVKILAARARFMFPRS